MDLTQKEENSDDDGYFGKRKSSKACAKINKYVDDEVEENNQEDGNLSYDSEPLARLVLQRTKESQTMRLTSLFYTELRRFLQYGGMKREMKNKAKVVERRDDSKGTQKKTTVSTTAAAATKTRRCFNCGDKNHVSADCPVKDKGVKCFKCKEHGHKATVCPTKAKEANIVSRPGDKKYMKDVVIGGQKFTALVDTGSDLTFKRTDEYLKIGLPVLLNRKVKFEGLGSIGNEMMGEFSARVIVDGEEYPNTFHVVSSAILKRGLLLETDFLNKVELRVKRGNVTFAKVEVNDNPDEPEIYNINVVDVTNVDLSQIKELSDRERL
ncbi:unnamed protein product [Brassicogethes aeneus]|uniref:CCHC-type domain-containing protein n=1 Tax=Brassicogethes aeneus TaxID=1431903 RepID=A0A9P0AYW8_BRAAE|nr:unnamed protein product [Brassicogethes aeneus]